MFRYYFFINMTIYFYVTFVLALFLILIHLGLAPHLPYLEKLTNFECGYHSFVGQSRLQFFVSFFVFGLQGGVGNHLSLGDKLPNSGDTHKIEREMDNCGSKLSPYPSHG